MAATFTVRRREREGSRFKHTVDVAIESATTLPLAVTAANCGLRVVQDVVPEGFYKSDGTQGYHVVWDPSAKVLNFLGSNGSTPDLVQDTSANNALVGRIVAYGQ